MPYVERGPARLYYEDSGGPGEVLVLSHGFASGSSMWDGQMELSTKFRLIRWDMRGHAQSSSPEDPSEYSKQHQVDDLAAVLDACGVQEAVLVGHSMGGFDSLLFYLSNQDNARRVKALVIFGSGPGFAKQEARDAWNQKAEELAEGFAAKGVEALVGSDRKKGHSEAGARVGLANSARHVNAQRESDPLFAKFPEGASVVLKRLPEIRVPMLVVIGARDKAFRRAAELMSAKAPLAQLAEVADAGHMANEKQPAAFNAIVERFALSLAARPRL